MKYNSLNIKLGLFLVHTFTFVTLLLEKACKLCRAMQPNKNILDEHGKAYGHIRTWGGGGGGGGGQ